MTIMKLRIVEYAPSTWTLERRHKSNASDFLGYLWRKEAVYKTLGEAKRAAQEIKDLK